MFLAVFSKMEYTHHMNAPHEPPPQTNAGSHIPTRIRRIFRAFLLITPLLLFLLVHTSALYSVQLSLIARGYPTARIVPKDRLDVFKYVSTDNFRSRAIVFADDRAVGWIYQPVSGFARFEPFRGNPSFTLLPGFEPLYDVWLPLAWSFKWWLLAVQGAVLLYFARKTKLGWRKVRLTP
jgi:hypothetical protein